MQRKVVFTYRDDTVGTKVMASIDGHPKAVDLVGLNVQWDIKKLFPGLDEELTLVLIEHLAKRFPTMDIPDEVKKIGR